VTPVKPVKLLIVDDDPDVAYSFSRVFREPAFDITEAKSGEQAMTILKSLSPDVVLMDVRMPGADGLSTLGRMVTHGMTFPVIIMTAYGSPRIANEAKAAGAFGCVMKPFDVTKIRELVMSAVEAGRTGSFQGGSLGGAIDGNVRSGSVVPKLGAKGWSGDIVELRAESPGADSGGLAAPIAGDDVFDLLFNEISRRQPLDPALDAFDVVEKHLIKRALEYCRNNQSKTARFLGITRNTLRKRIRKYGFDRDEE
jgi:DNA-binding NtrC family response regulator